MTTSHYNVMYIKTSRSSLLPVGQQHLCLRGSGCGIPYETIRLQLFAVIFFLNNQPDAIIIPILFCYKTLHVSGIFSAHHQELSTVHSALVSFMQVSNDPFQAESGWNCSSILTLVGNGHQKSA
jgi:hypothetical protein